MVALLDVLNRSLCQNLGRDANGLVSLDVGLGCGREQLVPSWSVVVRRRALVLLVGKVLLFLAF